jgi:hypothetical protein
VLVRTVLLYRPQNSTEDLRTIELSGDSSGAELWLIYPHRELIDKVASLEAGKEALPEGFVLDECAFSPPCPKCGEPSPMAPATGMYECRECNATF